MSELDPSAAGVGADPPPDPLSGEDGERLRARLVRAVARVCPTWLSAQAEDIVQTALMRVMEILRRREGVEGLSSSYLWKTAYSATVDEIRRHRRRREVSLESGAVEATVPAAQPGPEEAGRAEEIGRQMHDCLGRLVEARRLSLVLYLQGHTVPETARLLGWSEKRVENLVFRGLADLRRCLEGKGLRP